MLIIIILITAATNVTRIWMEMYCPSNNATVQSSWSYIFHAISYFDFDLKCDMDMILQDPPTSSDCCNICLANLSSGFCHKRGFLLVYRDDTLMTDSKTYGFVLACCFCCS